MMRRRLVYLIMITCTLVICSLAACRSKSISVITKPLITAETPIGLRPYLEILEKPKLAWSQREKIANSPLAPSHGQSIRNNFYLRKELDTMINKYAPRIWWHPKERHGPMDPLYFLKSCSLWVHHRWHTDEPIANQGEINPVELGYHASGLYRRKNRAPAAEINRGQDDSLYLKAEENLAKQNIAQVPIFWKLGRNPLSLNLNIKKSNHILLTIEYWYHSAYNQASDYIIGNHQGDWEGLAQVIDVDIDPISNKLEHKLVLTYLAAHEAGNWKCASDLEYYDDHPVIYSALGTHATYDSPGIHKTTFLTDVTARGQHWDTWHLTSPMALEPYFGYGGAWGNLSFFSFMSGPAVPGPFKELPKENKNFRTEAPSLLQRCHI